jgi:hypothetical protein
MVETGYPVEETHYPMAETGYPVEETRYPVVKSGYPVEETGYPVVETRYPVASMIVVCLRIEMILFLRRHRTLDARLLRRRQNRPP